MNTDTYIVINDGAFYKKGSVLIFYERTGMFAPNENDYPRHCHFLTAKFMDSLPNVFSKIDQVDLKTKGYSRTITPDRWETEWALVHGESIGKEVSPGIWDIVNKTQADWKLSKLKILWRKIRRIFIRKQNYKGRSL